jgi:preprotein translocase subunit SecB
MTDFETDAAGAPQEAQPGEPGFRILAQFVRDLSFENPTRPDSRRAAGGAPPQIDMGVEMNAKGRPDGLFEVDLKLSARADRSGDPVFHIELLYGGLFQIQGVPAEEMETVLLIECPRFLFPFARRIISDLTTEGGFPPFMIDPIDFQGIYFTRKAAAEQPGGTA